MIPQPYNKRLKSTGPSYLMCSLVWSYQYVVNQCEEANQNSVSGCVSHMDGHLEAFEGGCCG